MHSVLDHISLPISKLSQTKGLFGYKFLLTLGESTLAQIISTFKLFTFNQLLFCAFLESQHCWVLGKAFFSSQLV